jgi:hypothetical protein
MQGSTGTGKSNQQSPGNSNSNNKVTMRVEQVPQGLSQCYKPMFPIGHASARTNELSSQFTRYPRERQPSRQPARRDAVDGPAPDARAKTGR